MAITFTENEMRRGLAEAMGGLAAKPEVDSRAERIEAARKAFYRVAHWALVDHFVSATGSHCFTMERFTNHVLAMSEQSFEACITVS